MKLTTIQLLRRAAIDRTFFAPGTLANAFKRLKFVQADPIRSPARAQDLILRHRVAEYRAGDLERRYQALKLEEDFLYAYGFMTHEVSGLLHPRKFDDLTDLEREVLEKVREFKRTHPRDLDAHFGREPVINAWNGLSTETTRVMERLHRRGQLRIAYRTQGIKVYEPVKAPLVDAVVPAADRLRGLIMVIANILAPITSTCLTGSLSYLRQWLTEPINIRGLIDSMVASGELERQTFDGVDYLYPAGRLSKREAPSVVKFLAPFDPLVWDRRRFEHLWGWPYRFEAYTPAAKRLRGYYALPVLWGDRVIGWANLKVVGGKLDVDLGYVDGVPDETKFTAELAQEIGRMEYFLGLSDRA